MKKLFENEKQFLIQVSGILTKLMSGDDLNDTERSIVSTKKAFYFDIGQKVKDNTLNLWDTKEDGMDYLYHKILREAGLEMTPVVSDAQNKG